MKIVFSDKHKIHYPRHFLVNGAPQSNPEVPERATALLDAVRAEGHRVVAPEDYGHGPLADVHTAEYLDFLARIYERWQRIEGASPEVVPNIHPNGRAGNYPASAVGQAGYHMADTACPIGDGTWEAARESANAAIHAAVEVLEGGDVAYALCRPPGHHAFADMAGGFCYLNNSAIAAQYLRRSVGRVAILDVDLHHGNGTQGIFYDRPDVLTVSLHADPVRFYPFFWGYAEERGSGAGLGFNLNVPLPRGTADAAYLKAMVPALRRIQAFSPDVLVVALGLDAHESDPLAGLAITTPGFAGIGRDIAALNLPTVLVQEGGYMNEALGENLRSFLKGFADGRAGNL